MDQSTGAPGLANLKVNLAVLTEGVPREAPTGGRTVRYAPIPPIARYLISK